MRRSSSTRATRPSSAARPRRRSTSSDGGRAVRRDLAHGAAGFIGSHLVDRLLARGERVVGIDCFDTFYDPRIKRRNLEGALSQPRFTLVEGDIRDGALLRRTIEDNGVDVVVHLAARAGVRPSLENPELYADVNVRGTTLIFETARAAGVKRVVYASSSSVYGGNVKVPFSEDDAVDHPVSPYAATKKANELLAHVYHRVYGMTMVGLRYFTVYGPRQRPEMAIAKFTTLIDEGRPIPFYGDGHSRRDYTYIDDIVDGTIAALDRGEGHCVYNLGESATTTLADLVAGIGRVVGREPVLERLPDQPGDVPVTYADVSRARRELGYDPRVPVAEGLRRYVEWYRDQRRVRGESERESR
ncbi:MAG: NAD-dependent epimerase/dehydratase family protein [Acidobacteria bacterium]|nr:NAD-dependent epimerase/dehydratase family protein [Acidobacteriota bacterium]